MATIYHLRTKRFADWIVRWVEGGTNKVCPSNASPLGPIYKRNHHCEIINIHVLRHYRRYA